MENEQAQQPPVRPEAKGPAIHRAMAAIMAEVGGVAKGRKNTQQGYNFRGIADVYLACQPIMASLARCASAMR